MKISIIYQSKHSKLRKLGYNKKLTDIDKGIAKYLKILINE